MFIFTLSMLKKIVCQNLKYIFTFISLHPDYTIKLLFLISCHLLSPRAGFPNDLHISWSSLHNSWIVIAYFIIVITIIAYIIIMIAYLMTIIAFFMITIAYVMIDVEYFKIVIVYFSIIWLIWWRGDLEVRVARGCLYHFPQQDIP